MNKLFSKIAALSVGLAMAIGVGVAVGSKEAKEVKAADPATESFSHSDIAGMATAAAASTSGTYSVFTVTVDGISSSGFNATESVRVYKGASITISVSSGNITSATLTCTANGNAKYGPGCLTGSGYTAGTQKDGTWTGEASSFTLVAESNQARISDFSITYVAGGEVTTYTITYDSNGGSGEMENTVSANPSVAACEFEAPSGKVFERWNTQADGNGDDYAVGATPGDNLDLFAIWMDAPTCVTLTNIGSSIGSTASAELQTVDVADSLTSEIYTLNYIQCKKQVNAMFMTKNVNPLISNHTEIPGNIISVEVFINSGASGSTTYDVAFGKTEFTTATAGIGAVNITGGNSHVFDSDISDAKYFCITLGNSNNGQVLGLTINFEESDPSLNNMTIYFGDAAAEGQSIDYKSSGSHQFVAKEDSTALTDVKWSVSDETVATINASTGALSCVKPGSVTIYAEKDGYNKASASITIAKGSVSSLAVSGEMSKKEYTTAESWSHDGLVATATYSTGWVEDVSSSATWTYNPENPADGVESVVASASFGGKSASSSAQAVTVTVAHAGTAADPFTVAEGIAKCVEIGNKTGGAGPWVTTGVISEIVQVLTEGYQNARFYITEDGKTTSASIYAYDCKYLDNAGFTTETAAYMVVGATVTITGNLLNYNNNTPEYARGCYLLDIQQPETGDVDVTFEPASTSFEIGASGTFTASSETSGAVFTWAVDNSSVLSVNESTGAYEALSLGVARVTVTASAGGKEGYAFVDFAVCGAVGSPLSVTEANALAANVESGKTTSYYVYVEGYVKEFATSEKDGKPRALDIMSEDGISSIMVYTNVEPYAAFVDGLELGDYLKVKANVQNYNGKYELVTPEKVSNHASAFTFAFELLEQTDGQCATYVDGTSDYNEFKSFFEGKWGALEDAYNALASIEGEQTKVLNAIAKEDGNVLEQAVARYDFLVGKYKLDNFVTGRTPKTFVNSGLELSAVAENNTSIIIIVIAAASALAFTTLLVFKKKRQK